MEVTDLLKEKVVNALFTDMSDRGFLVQSDYAKYIKQLLNIPFDKSALSQIKKEDGRNAIKDSTWMILARHFNLLGESSWQAVQTHVYETMFQYMETCKRYGLWRVVCDHASFGKTFAARQFAAINKKTVVYVKCGDCPSRGDFIRTLSTQLGVVRTSSLQQTWNDTVDALLLLDKPLLILDEFGDVQDSIITLLKSLYNKADMGTHLAIGVLHIGADNLEKRLFDGRRGRRPSYAEYWSRFGEDIKTLNMPNKPEALSDKLRREAELIIDMNLPESLAQYRDEIIDKAVRLRDLRIIREDINIKRDLMSL